MINKLIGLLCNKPASLEETRLEDALRCEAKRILSKEEDDEVAVAQIVDRAKRKSPIREDLPASPWFSHARSWFAAGIILTLLIFVLQSGHQPKKEDALHLQAQSKNPITELDFSEPIKALAEPFAPFAFNPLEPAAEEWNRFTGETHEKAVTLLVAARSWTTLPSPSLAIDPENLVPELPQLERFSPYGNELQRLRNDVIKAFEALPFLSSISG